MPSIEDEIMKEAKNFPAIYTSQYSDKDAMEAYAKIASALSSTLKLKHLNGNHFYIFST